MKMFGPFSAGHRIPGHPQCGRIHGHTYEVLVAFRAEKLTPEGFIVDFGQLGPIQDKLKKVFDHTFLLFRDDPSAWVFKEIPQELIKLVWLPVIPTCENLSNWLFAAFNLLLPEIDRTWEERGLSVYHVIVTETLKTGAVFCV